MLDVARVNARTVAMLQERDAVPASRHFGFDLVRGLVTPHIKRRMGTRGIQKFILQSQALYLGKVPVPILFFFGGGGAVPRKCNESWLTLSFLLFATVMWIRLHIRIYFIIWIRILIQNVDPDPDARKKVKKKWCRVRNRIRIRKYPYDRPDSDPHGHAGPDISGKNTTNLHVQYLSILLNYF